MRAFSFFLLLSLFLWTGCSSSLEVSVLGEPKMNSGGNAAVVKVYQLTADGNFMSTPLSAFWRDDTGALGNELVAPPRKLTVYPSASRSIEFKLAGNTKYIGIAANLRDPNREQWRSIHALKGMGDRVSVTVGTNKVAVDVEGRILPNLGFGLGR